jgi:hypothetical protein
MVRCDWFKGLLSSSSIGLKKDYALKKLCALLVVFVCLAIPGLQASAMEAVALKRFPAMKTEEGFGRLLALLQRNEMEAAAEYLRTDGLLMEKGTEVILSEVGCDGQCVKFQIKGDQTNYWTVLTMDGEKVFEYKK